MYFSVNLRNNSGILGLRSSWAKLMGFAGRAYIFLMNRGPPVVTTQQCFIITVSTTVRAVRAIMRRVPMY